MAGTLQILGVRVYVANAFLHFVAATFGHIHKINEKCIRARNILPKFQSLNILLKAILLKCTKLASTYN